jgi:hypothetical protein
VIPPTPTSFASFIPEIGLSELRSELRKRAFQTLPFEPVLLDLLENAADRR